MAASRLIVAPPRQLNNGHVRSLVGQARELTITSRSTCSSQQKRKRILVNGSKWFGRREVHLLFAAACFPHRVFKPGDITCNPMSARIVGTLCYRLELVVIAATLGIGSQNCDNA
jgi:hypothetical protein